MALIVSDSLSKEPGTISCEKYVPIQKCLNHSSIFPVKCILCDK